MFLSELTDTFRFQEGFPNELHEITPKSLPTSLSFAPPCDKTTAQVRHTGHKVPLISFDPEFVPSIPRSITWCNVPGASNLGCLDIMTLYLISPICQVNSETTYPSPHDDGIAGGVSHSYAENYRKGFSPQVRAQALFVADTLPKAWSLLGAEPVFTRSVVIPSSFFKLQSSSAFSASVHFFFQSARFWNKDFRARRIMTKAANRKTADIGRWIKIE